MTGAEKLKSRTGNQAWFLNIFYQVRSHLNVVHNISDSVKGYDTHEYKYPSQLELHLISLTNIPPQKNNILPNSSTLEQ